MSAAVCCNAATYRRVDYDRVTAQTCPRDEVSRFERSVCMSPVESTLPAVTRRVGSARTAGPPEHVMRASIQRETGMTSRWRRVSTRLVTATARFFSRPRAGDDRAFGAFYRERAPLLAALGHGRTVVGRVQCRVPPPRTDGSISTV